DGWFHAAWGATLAAALWFCSGAERRWPIRQAPHAYARIGAPGLALFAGAWLVIANVHSGGDPAPLPALPLLNPMDLASLAALCSSGSLPRAIAIAAASFARVSPSLRSSL